MLLSCICKDIRLHGSTLIHACLYNLVKAAWKKMDDTFLAISIYDSPFALSFDDLTTVGTLSWTSSMQLAHSLIPSEQHKAHGFL